MTVGTLIDFSNDIYNQKKFCILSIVISLFIQTIFFFFSFFLSFFFSHPFFFFLLLSLSSRVSHLFCCYCYCSNHYYLKSRLTSIFIDFEYFQVFFRYLLFQYTNDYGHDFHVLQFLQFSRKNAIFLYLVNLFRVIQWPKETLLLLLLLLLYNLRISHTSVSWWSFTGVRVTASLLGSPGLFPVFWLSLML